MKKQNRKSASPLLAIRRWYGESLIALRYAPGKTITATVVYSPDSSSILRVRPVANDYWVGIIPAKFFPAAWKIKRPEVGSKIRVNVLEFTPENTAEDRRHRLVLDARSALPNPYFGLRSKIGEVETIEILKVCPERGLLVSLARNPAVIGRVFPDEISVARPLEGRKYQAAIMDVDEENQKALFSMTEAVRRHQKNRGQAA